MIFFRVSTKKSNGYGHFARLRAVRRFLEKPVHWFVDKDCDDEIKSKIPKEDIITEETNNKTSAKTIQKVKLCSSSSIMVCDSYNLNIMELVSSNVRIIMLTDQKIKFKCRNIININFKMVV